MLLGENLGLHGGQFEDNCLLGCLSCSWGREGDSDGGSELGGSLASSLGLTGLRQNCK